MDHVSNDARHLVVVAGCNGAGKTTYVDLRDDFRNSVRLDPDAFYARFGSWRVVLRAIDMAFASHNDIVLETTFSGRRVIERVRKARDDGFNVTLIFIGTASPAINMKRIAKRVREGGHDVPREDVLRRWPRSLENLLEHYQIADQLLILDNSSERFRFAMVAKREGDGSTPIFRDPRWARGVLRSMTSGRPGFENFFE